MVRIRRWGVVLGGVLVLTALPGVIAALPVRQSSISAAALLGRIQASKSAGYSGFAESVGGLSLPVTHRFTSLADLFGDRTQMRVWWRSAEDWRVDTVGLTGESDVHRDEAGTWTWEYESNLVTRTRDDLVPAAVHLPTAGDLLPTNLGRRLLSQARPDEVGRLPAKRIAGHNAPGLRLRPGEQGTTIARVDVWADAATGLPVRVEVYGSGTTSPVLSSTFLDFSAAVPTSAYTAFTPPAGARVRESYYADLASAIDELGGPQLPKRLAGIDRQHLRPDVGAIGVYGRGVTEFAVALVPDRIAGSLQRELVTTPGAAPSKTGRMVVAIGPLSLALTPAYSGWSWLLTGTVTPAALTTAAAQLPGGDGPGR